jgi:predicted TIM-barrel fold metal-dependent hydrolase
MACLAGVARPERILFGTDWPFANAKVIAEAFKLYEAAAPIAGPQRRAIDRANALALFPQFG